MEKNSESIFFLFRIFKEKNNAEYREQYSIEKLYSSIQLSNFCIFMDDIKKTADKCAFLLHFDHTLEKTNNKNKTKAISQCKWKVLVKCLFKKASFNISSKKWNYKHLRVPNLLRFDKDDKRASSRSKFYNVLFFMVIGNKQTNNLYVFFKILVKAC